jgi:two-component system nitrate/nitrite response regulator NarL
MASSLPLTSLGVQPSASRSQRVRVLIADETPMSCQLLKSALARSRFRFDIVGCVTNRAEFIDFLKEHPVDVTLVSESLQDGSFAGFELLNELRTSFPAIRVVVLLKAASRDLVIDAFRAGAEGVFGRTEPIQALCKCIQAVHEGQIWANSNQLRFVLDALIDATPLRVIDSKRRYLLAPRENEVANLIAEGMTNREAAQKLGVGEHTVSNYLFRIYEKLGISSRVELALYVVRQKNPLSKELQVKA